MRVADFDFDLPAERIALRPARPRDSARLLLVKGDTVIDRQVLDLPDLLRKGDVLVFNDTKVIPAQLEGRRGDASIGATLHKREGAREWHAFLRNARRVRVGDSIDFGSGVFASVIEKADDGTALLHFHGEEPVELLLERAGQMPLPPYIASRRPIDESDRDDYQTMFAREEGAVAAPTAALHFTQALLDQLEARGVGCETLTLHVGAGTFLPVKGERIEDDGVIRPFDGDTAIFITPGYRFKAIDGLITNFHLPRSTLFMLVSALMGLDVMQSAYAHAIEAGYRFYSYGDASLLLPG
jgi:S-adenosylmethionine:tRNA ribosyltransferase-isomerase